ncbi:hypothetical protein ACHAXR_013512 [Thalassiosira sp. AJA248-18]
MSPPRERDSSLPAVPEDSEAKLPSSTAVWNDEAEDREEQGLFERDNIAAGNENEEEGVVGSTTLATDSNDGESNISGESGGGIEPEPRLDPGPFYVQTAAGDSWELTWPIWHMLPRNERRAIATQHGMKSIGEFEEYMSLTRAVDESEGRVEELRSGVAGVANNDSAAVDAETAGNDSSPTTWQPPFILGGGEDDDDSSVSSSEDNDPTSVKEAPDTSDNAGDIDLDNHLEMIRLGGLPCSIPDEILHKCFAYLPIDDHATLALVSPHWHRFTRCESLYRTLCERVYLNQSKRKTLHISRFGNSYRKMLELRPRVRAGGGLYVLKYQEVRKIQRDMWTDIPIGAVLESVYYRYLYFFEDGRVMYALTHATPMEMIPRFSNMLLRGVSVKDKYVVWGRYQLRKDVVRVWVSQDWHDVCFQLKVIPSNKVLQYDTSDKGMCTTIKLEKHMSSPSGNFEADSYDLVNYEIPDHCYFRFLKDRRL